MAKSKYIKSIILIGLSEWFFYLAGITILVGTGILELYIPKFTGEIIDLLKIQTSPHAMTGKYVSYILIFSVLIFLARILWRYFLFGASRRIEAKQREKLFSHLQTLDAGFYNKNKTGDLMSYFTNDLNAVRMCLGPGMLMVIDVVALLSLVMYKMITTTSLSLTLFAVLPLPVIAAGSLIISATLEKRFKSKQEAFSKMSDFVQESVSGIRVIKSFIREKNETIKFFRINANNKRKNLDLIKLQTIFMPLIELITGVCFMITLVYGGYLTMNGSITLGKFVAFNEYLALLIWPMIALGWSINIFSQGLASFERISKIYEIKPAITDKPSALPGECKNGEINIKNLSFEYEKGASFSLKNITLDIKPGKTYAIIGRTGSGKSTLLNLLLRMYEAPPGTIKIDGKDITDIRLKDLRCALGYVPQDNYLFSESIKYNIGLTLGEFIEEQIRESARIAHIEDNILDFPDKYDTVIGEKGITLSGGQKQRISIARVLIRRPPILILDDSLSAVDTETEKKIFSDIREKRAGMTNIVVSHRISTIQDADMIFVMDNGSIVEHGKHSDLLENGGLYKDLYLKQILEDKVEQE